MTSNYRPFAVTAVAWLYIAVGGAMFAYHFPELLHLQKDAFVVELTEFLGLTAGVFMLRGNNWARWLALAWGAFHVALTAVPPFHGLIVHVIIFGGIAVILLRSEANQYFRSQPN